MNTESRCPCDRTERFVTSIPAGRSTIPRQIGTFPDFRQDMLEVLRRHPELSDWTGRDPQDLGIFLLESWAYLCDVLTFYDEVIAHESYLRTARRRPSVRKLVELIGYLPRPAAGSSVSLALLVEGRQSLSLPEGTGFRCGAFDDEAPQVFELEEETRVHPFNNRWTQNPVRPVHLASAVGSQLLFDPDTANLNPGDPVLFQDAQHDVLGIRVVDRVTGIRGRDGESYLRVEFDRTLPLSGDQSLEEVRLRRPTRTVALWSLTSQTAVGSPNGSGPSTLLLQGLERSIRPDDVILLSRRDAFRWFTVNSIQEIPVQIHDGTHFDVDSTTVETPPVTTPVTRLTLDTYVNHGDRVNPGEGNWSNSQRNQMLIHTGWVDAGTPVQEKAPSLDVNDPLQPEQFMEDPGEYHRPERFLLQDQNERGKEAEGRIDYEQNRIELDPDTRWDPDPNPPITIYGNTATVTRGETVEDEILGSGDRSMANQSFTLQNKPLTYLPAPASDNEFGLRTTLQVQVNGIEWKERRSFYGAGPVDPIYVVRHDDEQNTEIIFGDGQRGARLPTGNDNVRARYRYGGGAAAPPAGSIIQMMKPVKGIQSVVQPLPAAGGADAESRENIRSRAPGSALLLKPRRAISIQDIQVLAERVPGVRRANVEWSWEQTRQRALIQVWYFGDEGLEQTVRDECRTHTDPSTVIRVHKATALPRQLTIEVRFDPRRLKVDVEQELERVLTEDPDGILRPENLGVGRPLFRSALLKTLHDVEGVNEVGQLLWEGTPFDDFGISPGPGTYFELLEQLQWSAVEDVDE